MEKYCSYKWNSTYVCVQRLSTIIKQIINVNFVLIRLPRASDAPVVSGGSIFSWGTKFKYTGRTEKEVLEETGPLRKEEPPIQRCQTTCLRRKASSVPATPSTPSQDLVEIS